MKKKGSMMSVIAYMLAMMFIALILYRAITFAVEKSPDIEVRETAANFDYAFNAPEEITIIHHFPESLLKQCGTGNIMFGVDRKDGEIVSGSNIAVGRCGEECVSQFNIMSGMMTLMLTYDMTTAVIGTATAIFTFGMGSMLMKEATKLAKQQGKELTKDQIRELVEKMIKKKLTRGSFVKQKLQKKMLKKFGNSVPRKLSKGIKKGFKEAAIEGAEGISKRAAKKAGKTAFKEWSDDFGKAAYKSIWKNVMQEQFGKSLGKRAIDWIKRRFKNDADNLVKLADGTPAIKYLSEEGFTEDIKWMIKNVPPPDDMASVSKLVYKGKFTDRLTNRYAREVMPVLMRSKDNMKILENMPDKYFKEGLQEVTKKGTVSNLDILAVMGSHFPSAGPTGGRVQKDIISSMSKVIKNSPDLAGDPLIKQLDNKILRKGGDLKEVRGFILEKAYLKTKDAPENFESLIRQTFSYSDKTQTYTRAVIATSDKMTRDFGSRAIASQVSDIVMSGEAIKLFTRTHRKTMILKGITGTINTFWKLEKLKLRARGRYAVTGTGTATAVRGLGTGMLNPDVSVTEGLGMACCHSVPAEERGTIEALEFGSAFIPDIAGIGSWAQVFFDIQTLNIYAREIDACVEDTHFYSYINDSNIKMARGNIQKESVKGNSWLGLDIGINSKTILKNYISYPGSMFITKNLTSIEVEAF